MILKYGIPLAMSIAFVLGGTILLSFCFIFGGNNFTFWYAILLLCIGAFVISTLPENGLFIFDDKLLEELCTPAPEAKK